MVQDLSTQWIQSYPCTTKTSHRTKRSLRKPFEPSEKPKVIYTDNSLEFGKSCEELSWNHSSSTSQSLQKFLEPTRKPKVIYTDNSLEFGSEPKGIAERAARRVKAGTSAVLLQSGLDEKKVGGFHDMLLVSAKH